MPDVRYVTERALAGERGAALLRYLLARGADELSITVMALQDVQAPFADAFEDAMAPFELAVAPRRVVSSRGTDSTVRAARLWRFNEATLGQLLVFLGDDLFVCPAGPDGWLEDLAIYRGGELVLGLVSDEREGILRLAAAEHAEVAGLGIRSEATGDSIAW